MFYFIYGSEVKERRIWDILYHPNNLFNDQRQNKYPTSKRGAHGFIFSCLKCVYEVKF